MLARADAAENPLWRRPAGRARSTELAFGLKVGDAELFDLIEEGAMADF
jgi:hypothetical protein